MESGGRVVKGHSVYPANYDYGQCYSIENMYAILIGQRKVNYLKLGSCLVLKNLPRSINLNRLAGSVVECLTPDQGVMSSYPRRDRTW
jgi:hypothetical protein